MTMPLHLLFDPGIKESDRMMQMIRVAANLRAEGYEVVDGYDSELLVRGDNDTNVFVIDLRLRCPYVIPVFNDFELPLDGAAWGYRIPLTYVELSRKNGLWLSARATTDPESIPVMRSLVEFGVIERDDWFLHSESEDRDTQAFSVWRDDTGKNSIGRLKYYPNSHAGELIIIPTFAQLRQMVVFGEHVPTVF